MSFHKDLVGCDLHIGRSDQGAGSPIGNVTPGIVGQFYHDTSSNTLYVATGVTDTDWATVSGAADLRTLVLEYTFSDPASQDFGSLVANDLIIETRIEVDTPFDDAAALLSIGPVSNPDSLLATNQTNPAAAGTYSSQEGVKIIAPDGMRLKISAGTSTQGAGRAIVIFRRV